MPSQKNEEDSKKEHRDKFQGFYLPRYTPVPDDLFDQLLADLSGAELKVLLYIMRRTFGFKKGSDRISKSQLEFGITTKAGTKVNGGTGLSRRAIRLAIDSLVEKNIIIKKTFLTPEKGHERAEYALNIIGYDPWVLSTQGGGVKSTQGLGYSVPLQETVVQETEKQQHVVAPSCASEDPLYPKLIQELVGKGINQRTARALASKYLGRIEEKLKVFDWLVESHSHLIQGNPPGYLRRSIEEDWQAPENFVAEVEREKKEQQAREAQEKEERLKRELRERAIKARESMDESERERLGEEAEARIPESTKNFWKSHKNQELARRKMEEMIKEEELQILTERSQKKG